MAGGGGSRGARRRGKCETARTTPPYPHASSAGEPHARWCRGSSRVALSGATARGNRVTDLPEVIEEWPTAAQTYPNPPRRLHDLGRHFDESHAPRRRMRFAQRVCVATPVEVLPTRRVRQRLGRQIRCHQRSRRRGHHLTQSHQQVRDSCEVEPKQIRQVARWGQRFGRQPAFSPVRFSARARSVWCRTSPPATDNARSVLPTRAVVPCASPPLSPPSADATRFRPDTRTR